MKVADVMSHGVLSVGPGDPVRKAAELMLRYGVNGFPVLDQGKLVGMITQRDFLRRTETGTERYHSKLAELFADLGKLADEYVRSHARTVADIMTREVITISADAPLSDAVDLMVRHHVKRLPVVGAIGVRHDQPGRPAACIPRHRAVQRGASPRRCRDLKPVEAGT